MAGIEFKSDATAVVAGLEQLAAKSGDPTPMLEEARAILAEGEAEAFDSSGRSIGESWSPLSEETARIKGSDRILVMTGRLRAALSNPGNVRVVGGVAELSSSEVPYAHYHVTGTGRMPARPMMGIGLDTQRRLAELMAKYMAAGE